MTQSTMLQLTTVTRSLAARTALLVVLGSAAAAAPAAAAPIDRTFNFQPDSAPIPANTTKDNGSGYSDARGYGWVRTSSLRSAPHLPENATGNTRYRSTAGFTDHRLDTFIHMQYTGSGGTTRPIAWELKVPNGSYDVTAAVGDPTSFDSTHLIRAEGQTVVPAFTPDVNGVTRFRYGSATVTVTDGRLTVDAVGGSNTKLDYVTVQSAPTSGLRPSALSPHPADGETVVPRGDGVSLEVNLPNVGQGVAPSTLPDGFHLYAVMTGQAVAGLPNTSGGHDTIVFTPDAPLAKNTEYRIEVTNQLTDDSGQAFQPFTSTFRTDTADISPSTLAKFTKVPQASTVGNYSASVQMGPDDNLYASGLDGNILRYPVNAGNGNLGTPTTISTVADFYGGPRHIIGMAFDPNAPTNAPVLWVTTGYADVENVPDWTGSIARLSGPNLSNIQEYVTHLPRSIRDHETNSIAFGPDGKLYLTQGSMSSAGAPDRPWGNRNEHILSAALLRFDPSLVSSPPLDAKTTDGGGTYNPFAPGAPLTIYASGIRNAYDLVWASNGQLYSPVNGSGGAGNAPATPASLPAACAHRVDFATNGAWTGPAVPGQLGLGAQDDFLLRVQPGRYYGHPNPSRCEYAFFGANPTSGADTQELLNYPVGVLPDRNFAPASRDLGLHKSPDGAIQYESNRFSGRLRGKLLVTRYSEGKDVIALTIDPTTKEISSEESGITGLTGFDNPLDITEDTRSGNLYVTELSTTGQPDIVLLRPDES